MRLLRLWFRWDFCQICKKHDKEKNFLSRQLFEDYSYIFLSRDFSFGELAKKSLNLGFSAQNEIKQKLILRGFLFYFVGGVQMFCDEYCCGDVLEMSRELKDIWEEKFKAKDNQKQFYYSCVKDNQKLLKVFITEKAFKSL